MDDREHLVSGEVLSIGIAKRIGNAAAGGGDGGEARVLEDARASNVPSVGKDENLAAVVELQELTGQVGLSGFFRFGHAPTLPRVRGMGKRFGSGALEAKDYASGTADAVLRTEDGAERGGNAVKARLEQIGLEAQMDNGNDAEIESAAKSVRE